MEAVISIPHRTVLVAMGKCLLSVMGLGLTFRIEFTGARAIVTMLIPLEGWRYTSRQLSPREMHPWIPMGTNIVSGSVAKLDTIYLGGSLYVHHVILDYNVSYHGAVPQPATEDVAPLPAYKGPSYTPHTVNLLVTAAV